MQTTNQSIERNIGLKVEAVFIIGVSFLLNLPLREDSMRFELILSRSF